MATGDIREVEIFGGAKGPYGDAVRNRFRPGSYKSTMHMLVEQGQMVPFFQPTEVNTIFAPDAPPLTPRFVIEWENEDGDPVIFYAVSGADIQIPHVTRIDPDGSANLEIPFTLPSDRQFANAPVGAFHSDGSTVPYFFLAYGSTGNITYRDIAGTWTNVSSTPAQADGLFAENGNLWAIIGHQVRKWQAGVNPTSGTALAAVDVGNASFDITGAGLLARSYIVFAKPDGIYVYDIDHNRFENIATDLANNPHPLTGRGMFTYGGEVYVPIGWGGMVRVTRDLDVVTASPLPRAASPDQDIAGRQRVTAMAADAGYIYATLEPFTQRLGSEVGVAVVTTSDDASFNDRTAVSTDDDPSTSWTIADIFPGDVKAIYVGADRRFTGFWFDIVATLAAASPSGTLQYWDGDAWQTISHTQYLRWLGESGALLPDEVVPSDWEPRTVGPVSGKYWLRWEITSPGTLVTATEIREVRVFEDAQPLPGGSNVAQSAYDEGGLRTKLLRGFPAGDTMVWDDIGSLAGDMAGAMIFSRVVSAGGGKQLFVIGPNSYMRFPVGNSVRPTEERYPDVQNSFASLFRAVGDDRISNTESAPTTLKGIEYIDISGKSFDGDNDMVQAWVSFDGGAPQYYGAGRRLPTRLQIPRHDAARGFEYSVTVALRDGARDAQPTRITRIVAGVYQLDGPPDKA